MSHDFSRFIGCPVTVQVHSHNNLFHHFDGVINDIYFDNGQVTISHQNGQFIILQAKIEVTDDFITFTDLGFWTLVVLPLPLVEPEDFH